ncbi:MAG: CbtB domain-containing protein [bacterium]
MSQDAVITSTSMLQPLFAIIIGIFIVGFVGFSQIGAVHNAAHDTRHANGFPCH